MSQAFSRDFSECEYCYRLDTTNIMTVVQTEKLIKVKKRHYQKKGGNGGVRPGSGRPEGSLAFGRRINKQLIDAHINEEFEVRVTDSKTGRKVTATKPRFIVVLEKLYEIGMRGDGDANALDKWLNRAIGKPVQPIVGEEEEPPVQIDLGMERILNLVYGSKAETEAS